MNKLFDVAIVGASLAGSSAALTLARGGARVLLIDKHKFPRQKACGEGLSEVGSDALDKLGAKKILEGTQQLKGFHVFKCDQAPEKIAPLNGCVVGVQRAILDNQLLTMASEFATVTPYLNSAVREISKVGAGYSLRLDSEVVSSRHVILANGISTVPLSEGKSPKTVAKQGLLRCGYTMVFEGGDWSHLQHVTIMRCGEFDVFLTLTERSRLNVSLLGSQRALARIIDPMKMSSLLAPVVTINPSQLIFRQGAAPVGSKTKEIGGEGMWFAGDACETFDPVAGMGMTHALTSGRLAAQHILSALSGKETSLASLAYAHQRRAFARKLRIFTSMVYFGIRNEMGAQISRTKIGSALFQTTSKFLLSF